MSFLEKLRIECRSLSELKPYENNPRTHSKKQIRQIAESIKTFGWTNPILVDADGGVIAGHGRLLAAQLLNLSEVPVIRLENMSDAQKRAYIIADNKLAENAGWDKDLLKLELGALLEIDLGFDISVTGFEMAEIDLIIGEDSSEGDTDPDDQVPEVSDGPAMTQSGDVWEIGPHRLTCANALDAQTYVSLLDGEKAQLVFTDPPYNVPIDGHVSGLGSVKHREFSMAAGELTGAQFTDFLGVAFGHLATHSEGGSIHFICMDWRHMGEVLAAGDGPYTELKNLCVWAKTNGGMGSLYRSQHELVFVFKAGSKPHINNVELGKFGRNRTNLWSYAGQNSFGSSREDDLKAHPTVKPVQMVADAIMDCSHRGGIVLDAFAGSGTTLLAAHRTGRRGYGIEIDAAYCDVILRRLWDATGIEPVQAATGEPFSEREAGTTGGQTNGRPLPGSQTTGRELE